MSAPAAAIPRLGPQKGVFTLIHDPKGFDEPDRVQPFDDVLEELAEEDGISQKLLVQVTLPRAAAPELLRRLASHGVDAATVHGDHRGAAEALLERCFWDKPDPPWPDD